MYMYIYTVCIYIYIYIHIHIYIHIYLSISLSLYIYIYMYVYIYIYAYHVIVYYSISYYIIPARLLCLELILVLRERLRRLPRLLACYAIIYYKLQTQNCVRRYDIICTCIALCLSLSLSIYIYIYVSILVPRHRSAARHDKYPPAEREHGEYDKIAYPTKPNIVANLGTIQKLPTVARTQRAACSRRWGGSRSYQLSSLLSQLLLLLSILL